MRCFIALDLPADAKTALGELENKTRDLNLEASFTGANEQHLTLLFLGEVRDNEVPRLVESFKQIKFKSFPLQLKGTGFFPNEEFIKVFWIGVDGGKQLIDLQKQLEQVTGAHNPKSQFSPHITICRPKTRKNLDKLKELQKQYKEKVFSGFAAKTLTFYKSELGAAGHVYTALAQLTA
ncbi:MAG TPA: RNA 2',3'-cyclic phosphodiesterase [Candidatus Norongarragalinales archaeon]|jgi:2'-5' RNA ligase|nr:RNA 2',3'-cyclic phosphodiesterase [Candidatus Norongarragalinales archaeon]